MASKSAIKGSVYERELAKHLKDVLGIDCFRAPLSGGGRTFGRHIGISAGSADLEGTPHIWVEAKRTECFRPHEAIAQAELGISARNSTELPVVITRRNRMTTGQSLVVMRLDDWLKLYKSYIDSN